MVSTIYPILQQAREDKPFFIKTDASNYAIGAVLVQGEKAEKNPIEYASRLITSTERNYSTTERKALAIVWAVNKFQGYIEGGEITLMTDHQHLKWLMSLKSPTGRLARWALQLQPYNFKIFYTPWRSNMVADMLSRPPCDEQLKCDIQNFQIDMPSKRPKEIREAQLKDEELKKIIESFENNDENISRWASRGYLMNDGILYRYSPESDAEEAQLVIPLQEREAILFTYHDATTAGHYGIDRAYSRIAARYYWPGLKKDVARHIVYLV